MLKRVLIIFGLISLIFIFGFWAENQLKTIDFKEITKTRTSDLTEESREKAKVAKVIDGDTIELSDKRKVRYIGINSFEMNDERLEIKCLAEKAREANRNLVENKEIEMEKDVSDTDKYGRLLRYVWIDGILVNEELVKNGWAEVSSFPPDIKYQERFRIEQIKAKLNDLGIWGNTCQ
ncbi:MAG: thermonuclease family protein [Candidatus Shapirobacteria bacterium]|jgi:micrococcal nuclease|nr:thermonuclease family protein [Candidatus Shapirobacteria bacterium]